FDDGYLDALTVASPILMELGIPATFFVNTDQLTDEHERWWDILERAFSSTVPAMLELTVGGQAVRLPTTTAAERTEALEQLNRLAWPLDQGMRRQLATDVLTWSRGLSVPRDSHRVLTASEIRALGDRPGHTIGAHTTHHLALTHHPSSTKRV